ncbi:exodeoxyribonuclease III, partial [Acinetobacter baumannii]|nr:exodeoxyribonuclease III [Acinetobacter baumannii]
DPEARAISAMCDGVRVHSLYIPNGRELADPHYTYKLEWLARLRDHAAAELAADPDAQIALTGDFNVAPLDEDVWDMEVFRGKTHVSEPERAAFQRLEESGLEEITRRFTEDARYTYFDYKGFRFQKGEG